MAVTRRPTKGNEAGSTRRGRPRRMSRAGSNTDAPDGEQPRLPNIEEGTAEMASQQLAQEALRSETLQSAEGELTINSEKLIEELTILYGTADGILKGLSLEKDHISLEAALADPTSRLNKKFNALMLCLEDEKQSFTLPEDPIFIDAPRLNRILMPTLHNGLTEAVVSKINLATLALQLRDWYGEKKVPEDALKDLDNEFPSPFVTSFVKDGRVGSSKLFQGTFQLALEIRTQVALLVLAEHGAEELRRTFFDDLPEQSAGITPSLMRWDEKVNISDMPDQSKAVEARLQEISSIVGSGKLSKKAQQTLNQKYEWSVFITNAMIWVQRRADELTSAIHRHGFTGAFNELPVLLGGGIPGATGQTGNDIGYNYIPDTHSGARSKGNNYERPGMWNSLQAAGMQNIPGMPSRQRSMLDSQPNAEMVHFDTQFGPGDIADGNIMVGTDVGIARVARWNAQNSQNAKRKHDELDPSASFQPDGIATQDEGFTSTPVPATKKRQGRPPKPAPALPDSSIDVEEQRRRALESGMTYSQLQNDLKRNKTIKAATSTGEIKSRKRWTIEETGTLINLITQYGVSWAQIKKFDEANGDVLMDRDQVNLKDKARNIKFDILKSQQPLPPNFDLVTLSATMKAKLANKNPPETTEIVPPSTVEANIAQLNIPFQPPSPGTEGEEPAFEDPQAPPPTQTQ